MKFKRKDQVKVKTGFWRTYNGSVEDYKTYKSDSGEDKYKYVVKLYLENEWTKELEFKEEDLELRGSISILIDKWAGI